MASEGAPLPLYARYSAEAFRSALLGAALALIVTYIGILSPIGVQ